MGKTRTSRRTQCEAPTKYELLRCESAAAGVSALDRRTQLDEPRRNLFCSVLVAQYLVPALKTAYSAVFDALSTDSFAPHTRYDVLSSLRATSANAVTKTRNGALRYLPRTWRLSIRPRSKLRSLVYVERSASYYVRLSEIGRIAALRYNGTKTSIVTAAHALLQPARQGDRIRQQLYF